MLRCRNYINEYNRLSYGVRIDQWDMRYDKIMIVVDRLQLRSQIDSLMLNMNIDKRMVKEATNKKTFQEALASDTR